MTARRRGDSPFVAAVRESEAEGARRNLTRKALCGWRTIAWWPGASGGEVRRQVRDRAWGRGQIQAREVLIVGASVSVVLLGVQCAGCGAVVRSDGRGAWVDATGGDGCGAGVHAPEWGA